MLSNRYKVLFSWQVVLDVLPITQSSHLNMKKNDFNHLLVSNQTSIENTIQK